MNRKKYIQKVEAMSNFQLFEEHCSNIVPDDYDSCHTKHGEMLLEVSENEVYNRINNNKFFK